MTDEADISVVLAELQVALFRECNNQRLSPWGRPFYCSPDPVTEQDVLRTMEMRLKLVCYLISFIYLFIYLF